MKTISDDFAEKVTEIMLLSKKVNGEDSSKILDMICKHSQEISQLYEDHNDHWMMETADLIVLCCELLLYHGVDINEVLTQCLPRFYKKLHDIEREVGRL
ncbi:MAG: hypothetical protein R6V50_02405 [Thermoplasmatota archaeon]